MMAVYYDPEVLVQSFYVLPRLLPGLYVTLRLMENETAAGTTVYLGGFCFDPDAHDMNGIQLPRWSVREGARDTGPMESDKAAAASKLAKDLSAYWLKTVAGN
jgi:hypothetical protein